MFCFLTIELQQSDIFRIIIPLNKLDEVDFLGTDTLSVRVLRTQIFAKLNTRKLFLSCLKVIKQTVFNIEPINLPKILC